MGDFLTKPITEKESENNENNTLRYGAGAMQGWRKRMEDSHIADLNVEKENLNFFGVFDGHGGKEVAVFVKNHLTEELTKTKGFKTKDYKNALIESFLVIDKILIEPKSQLELVNESKKSKEEEDRISKDQPKDSQMDMFKQLFNQNNQENNNIAMHTGCTASAMVMDEKNMYFANSGDSRAVLCKKGVAYAMSEDHKPDMESEKNRIYKAEGWVSEGRVKGNLNLSRSLGDLEYKQNKKLPAKDQMITAYPDVRIEPITSDCDFIIMACDGIWDCKTNQEACDFVSSRIKKNPKRLLSEIIGELLDDCLATDIHNETGVGCDNMTCLVIQFKK